MTTKKPTSGKQARRKPAEPFAERPQIPKEYGVPKDKKGLLPWSHVSERMTEAMVYWVCTVSPDGRPHATPVDGLWLEDRLYFGGSPKTRRSRNLAANPAACVHLESGSDVVILHGDVLEMKSPERSLTVRLSEGSHEKYGWGPKPEQYEAGGVQVFLPTMALAWKQFPKDATRWRFPKSD